MTHTITRQTRTEPSNVAKLVKVFQNPNERIEFEDGYLHYIHPNALLGLTGLTVRDLKNSQIHFLGNIQGEQIYEDAYRPDCGVLNFVDCEDLLVTNAGVTNTRQFSPGNLTTESSCAVNVQQSRMRFERCRFDSFGKSCLSIHSDSYVELSEVELAGYYFELMIGSSEVVADNLKVVQDHPDPDSHSAIWVNCSHRQAITNTLFKDTLLTIRDSSFDMMSGRSLVSGNGAYDARSVVNLERIALTPSMNPTFGICTFHENFNSLTVNSDFVQHPISAEPMLDYVSTPETGFAKYVDYYEEPSRPGKGLYDFDELAPILVDGVNSDDVWATL